MVHKHKLHAEVHDHEHPHTHTQAVEAVRKGEVAVQRWLSTTSKLRPPQIRLNNSKDAVALMAFRSEVGHLDSRCDRAAESLSCYKMENLMSLHVDRLQSAL